MGVFAFSRLLRVHEILLTRTRKKAGRCTNLIYLVQILVKEPTDVWRIRLLLLLPDPLADFVAAGPGLNGHLGPVGNVGPRGGCKG